MRLEDAQTLAVFMFESGMAPSQVDAAMGAEPGFARAAVVEWRKLMTWRNTW